MSTATTPLYFASRDEYRDWAEAQPSGRFERIEGEIIAMAPERIAHVRVKNRVWRALDDAIRQAGAPCEALGDGITIEIADHTDYQPDAVVNCGEPLPGEEVAARNPVIIVEVLSPSTRSVDTERKLGDYFTLPSIRHCLILRADKPHIIHHQRNQDGPILTRLFSTGELRLDPSGIVLTVEDISHGAIR